MKYTGDAIFKGSLTVQSNKPLDNRLVVNTYSDLQQIPNTYKYEGMPVICADNGDIYIWTANGWIKKGDVTESFVNEKIAEVVGAAPEALDTLKEIADKLDDNDDVVTALTNSIAEKTNTTDFNEFVNEVNTNNENTTGALVQLQENIDNIQLTPGPPGDDGKSAYEIYISRIPQGEPIPSEEEWLQSLVGPPGETGEFDSSDLENYATRSYVSQIISETVGDTPETLEALQRLSELLDDDVMQNLSQALAGKADKTGVYSKSECDERYLTRHQDISGKANVSDVYPKTFVYTKSEIDNKIGNLGNNSENNPHSVKSYISQEIEKVAGVSPEILDTLQRLSEDLDNNQVVEGLINQLNEKANSNEVYSKNDINNIVSDINNRINIINQRLDNLVNSIQQLEANKERIKHVFLTQDMYNSLESYDSDTIYFIVNEAGQSSGFTYTFPFILG